MSWFEKLFIKEAKAALNSKGTPSNEQVNIAVNEYLAKNPVSSATAEIKDGVLKVV
jgi:hypothetical protein